MATLPGACTFPEYQFEEDEGSGGAIGGTGSGGAGASPVGSGGDGGSAGIGETGGSGGEAPEPTCTDGIENGDETAVDCGGSECAACANGEGCVTNDDCISQRCHPLDLECGPGLAVQCRCAMGDDCLNGSPLTTRVEFRLQNFSDVSLDLEGVILRYYFVPNGNDQAACAESGLPGGCEGMRRVEQLPYDPPANKASHILELEFSDQTGSLPGGASTATSRIEVTGQPTLPEDDYSFERNPVMQECKRITLYKPTESGGALIWGDPPTAD